MKLVTPITIRLHPQKGKAKNKRRKIRRNFRQLTNSGKCKAAKKRFNLPK